MAVFAAVVSPNVQAVEDVVDLVADGAELGPNVRRNSPIADGLWVRIKFGAPLNIFD